MPKDDTGDAAPDDRAHAHRARFAVTVKGRSFDFVDAVYGEKSFDGDHFGMRGGILLLVPQIGSARERFAAAYDHGAEIVRIVTKSRFLKREPKFFVLGRRRLSIARPKVGRATGRASAPSASVATFRRLNPTACRTSSLSSIAFAFSLLRKVRMAHTS
jgi:hypothetical protein